MRDRSAMPETLSLSCVGLGPEAFTERVRRGTQELGESARAAAMLRWGLRGHRPLGH